MKNFKEMLDKDLDRTFYNTEEFAELQRVRIDGIDRNVPVIFDSDAAEARRQMLSGDHAQGIYQKLLVVRIRLSDLEKEPIITALNLTGSFVSWGNETACYPANTDVTDYFYCVSRMFSWVANSVILSMWSKVDKKLNKRLIESVTQSINIWLNGLMAEEKILGGRVEFLEEENTTADLLAGKAKFHIYLTPPSPAKELDFVLEYDVSYLENIFA